MSNPNPSPSTRFGPGNYSPGRPKASKGFVDCLARYSTLKQTVLNRMWAGRDKLAAQDRIALRMVREAASDAAVALQIHRYLDRLVGRPRQSVEVSGDAAAPLAIEIVDSRNTAGLLGEIVQK